MPAIRLTVPHTLGQQTAQSRLAHFMSDVKDRYQGQFQNLEESWQGNTLSYSFKTFGLSVGGTLTVEENQALLHAQLPLAAAMFKGKIESEIRQALQQALNGSGDPS